MRKNIYERHEGETGNQFEADFIGQIDTRNPIYKEALAKAEKEEIEAFQRGDWPKGKPEPTKGYLRRKKAVELAKKFQPHRPPFGPTNPDKPFSKDMRLEIIKLFEKFVFKRAATLEERKKFQFFTAADAYKNEDKNINNSPLDKFHGIDAWLEYTDENGNILTATFDLTKNPKKIISKENVLIREQELRDPHLELDEYEKAIETYGKRALEVMIYEQLKEKKIIL